MIYAEPREVVYQERLVERGMFATKRFEAGEAIMVMDGVIMGGDELEEVGYVDGYPLQIAEDKYVKLELWPELVNHSCNPNAGIRYDLTLVAMRTINAGEQLTYDYSTTMNEGEDGWTMECRCGYNWCRKTIKDFATLPQHRQLFYLDRGVVLGHVTGR